MKKKNWVYLLPMILFFCVMTLFIAIIIPMTNHIGIIIAKYIGTLLIYIFCTAIILFFSILLIQIPILSFLKYQLHKNLSEENFEISQMLCDSFGRIKLSETYTDDELANRIETIDEILHNHKICAYFYNHLYRRDI